MFAESSAKIGRIDVLGFLTNFASGDVAEWLKAAVCERELF
jgi:hypothetical protein